MPQQKIDLDFLTMVADLPTVYMHVMAPLVILLHTFLSCNCAITPTEIGHPQKWSPGTNLAAKIGPVGPALDAKSGPPLPKEVPHSNGLSDVQQSISMQPFASLHACLPLACNGSPCMHCTKLQPCSL